MKDLSFTNTHRWLIPVSAVSALMLLIGYALGLIGSGIKIPPGSTPVPAEKQSSHAETFVVGKQTADNIQLWPGVLRSKTVTAIAPKITARIVSINVNSGDKVRKGAVIARLDERELRSAYNEANAALAAAKAIAAQATSDLKRSHYLYEKEAATRASHDAAIAHAGSAQSAVRQAGSAVEHVGANLSETTLIAPFDGVISERLKEAGDMGLPGVPVAIILKPNDLRLEATIPGRCSDKVHVGMPVLVRVDNLSGSLQAKIDEIAPEIDRQTGTQLVKATLTSSAGVQQGEFAWLELSCDAAQQRIFIPQTAVLHYGQLEAVKIVENNQIYTRHIRTGKQQGTEVEVLSGLRVGESVITQSAALLEQAGSEK